MYILETNNLVKRYNKVNVLNNLNIHVKKGSIYGLIGKNGSGKTTLIRIITGLTSPTSGDFSIYGINGKSTDIIKSREKIGAIIETPAVFLDMTAKDNLIIQSSIVGNKNLNNLDEILKLVGLENTKKKKVRNFSLGMKQRLGIAIALINNPDFLILDEPINGLDPEGIIEVRELILKLNKEQNITFLISSHYLDELAKVATNYGFLDKGEIIEEISNQELLEKVKHKFVIKVNNKKDFLKYFKENNINYELNKDDTINIYEQDNLAKFIIELTNNNLIVEEAHEFDETLENYYMNLIGGNK